MHVLKYLNRFNTLVENLGLSQEIDGRLVDLRSRGLCFVPISFMQKMTQQQEHVDPSSYPRKNIGARTF